MDAAALIHTFVSQSHGGRQRAGFKCSRAWDQCGGCKDLLHSLRLSLSLLLTMRHQRGFSLLVSSPRLRSRSSGRALDRTRAESE